MDLRSLEREEGAARDVRPEPPAPAPAPVAPGSLAWASAVGNQAVQRLARQEVASEEEVVPDGLAALEAAGIGPEEAAGLEAVDDLAEDELPE
jgi:hypothetical protein